MSADTLRILREASVRDDWLSRCRREIYAQCCREAALGVPEARIVAALDRAIAQAEAARDE